MASDGLQQLLSRAQDAGDWDSHGEFTVALQELALKLGRNTLADRPGAYVLKIVQAGVAAGAEAMAVRVNKDSLEVGFGGRAPARIGGELASALLNPASRSSKDPMGYLALGILSALAGGARRVEWSCCDGKMGERLSVEGENIDLTSMTEAEVKASRTHGFVFRAFRDSSQMVPEHEAVEVRCGYCPIPLSLNGCPIDGRGWLNEEPDEAEWLMGRLPPGLRLAELYLPFEGKKSREALSLPPATTRRKAFATSHDFPSPGDVLLLLGAHTGRLYQGAIALEASVPRISRLRFVRYGVSMDLETTDKMKPGVTAVLEASHLTTDASGFRIVDDEKKSQAVSQIARAAEQLYDPLRTALTRVRHPRRYSLIRPLQSALGMVGRLSGSTLNFDLPRSNGARLKDFALRRSLQRRIHAPPGVFKGELHPRNSPLSGILISNGTFFELQVGIESSSHYLHEDASLKVLRDEPVFIRVKGTLRDVRVWNFSAVTSDQQLAEHPGARPGTFLQLHWNGQTYSWHSVDIFTGAPPRHSL